MDEAKEEIIPLTIDQMDKLFHEARIIAEIAKDHKLSDEKRRFNGDALAGKTLEIRSKLDLSLFKDIPPRQKFKRVDSDWHKNWGIFYNYEDGSLYEGPHSDQEQSAPDLEKIKPIQDPLTWSDNGLSIINSLHSFVDVKMNQAPTHK